ncbi:hypothetical protein ACHHYP_04910 [Achlya hypogyna]|uniref:J domain-containing protein n=1 Tax=Achlya hypogyna TaxID=1202772 RepID=A0A1V9YZR6_ACHHY|nr:hypothetical protein ACHHYP_04910 [Achlya hypogyna]
MGQAESAPAAIARPTTKVTETNLGAPVEDMSLSTAILFARKFTQRHPLFAWREDEHLLRGMGCRALKHSFVVDFTDLSGASSACVLLSLVPTQASLLCHQSTSLTTYKLKALLVALKHPYLLPVLDVHYANDTATESMQRPGILVAQPFVSAGSLKDLLYHKANPRQPYTTKYALQRMSGGLPRAQVARYGRQILLGLDALRSKGIVCEHLKTSNVLLDNGVARIGDVYNSVLGLEREPRWRAWTVPLEAEVDIDLLLFGHCLYEMACGQELAAVVPSEEILTELHPEIAHVLRVIFMAEGPDVSVESLMELPLFAVANGINDTPLPALRLDSQMKTIIKTSMRINQARRHAYRVQFDELQAVAEARRQAEASHDDKLKGHSQRARALVAKKTMKRSRNRCHLTGIRMLAGHPDAEIAVCLAASSQQPSPGMDYYRVMNLTRTATQKEIKRAYLQLARQLHPDVTGNDLEKAALFKKVSEANSVLSDPVKRAEYDNRFSYQRGNAETQYSPRGQTTQRAANSQGRHYGINEDVWYAHHYGVHASRTSRWTGKIHMNYGSHIPEEMMEAQMENIRRQEATNRIQNGYMLRRELRLKKQAEEKLRAAGASPQPKADDDGCCIS